MKLLGLISFLILANTYSGSALASGADILGQSTIDGSHGCKNQVIDYAQGFADADKDAAEQCGGRAKRTSAYEVFPHCATVIFWGLNYSVYEANFNAHYQCMNVLDEPDSQK